MLYEDARLNFLVLSLRDVNKMFKKLSFSCKLIINITVKLYRKNLENEFIIPIEDLLDPILPLEATLAVTLLSLQASKFSSTKKNN
jgi:hypothetical protein